MDLVHRKAYRWDGHDEVEIPIPDDMADEVARRRDELLEAASEADDDVMTKYLEGEEISDHELEICLRKGVKDSVLAPVLVGSAAKGIELRGLLDAIVRYLPSPGRRAAGAAPPTRRAPRSRSRPTRTARSLVRVFKTTADPFVGRLTYLRVCPGTLHSQAHVWNTTRDEDERIGQLLLLHGKEQEPIGELKAGEIGAVAKLTVTETGDTLATKERRLRLPPIDFPAPSLVVAIEPVSKQDLDKMGPALQRMLEEEPTVRLERTAARRAGPGHHGRGPHQVIIERLKRKFGAAVATHTPKVPYKETIRGTTQVHGRYKKQTGGHGMFGDVWLELEPNPDGGVEFAERVVGGSVPKGFFAGVEKGIREAAAEGVVAGYPLSDFKATLYDGSFHPVDSNELSFKIAASMALKDGVHQAKPALMEPIMAVEIRIPEVVHGRGQPRPQRPARPGPGHGHAGRRAGHHAPTCPRPSCSRTPRSCARWPRAEARSRRRSTTTRTCRRTSPRRSSRPTARSSRPPAATAAATDARADGRTTGDRRTVRRASASGSSSPPAARARRPSWPPRPRRRGWDGVFTWDGIALGTMDTYDPWVVMAAMAMRTSRVRLGRDRHAAVAASAVEARPRGDDPRPAVRRAARPAGRPRRAR